MIIRIAKEELVSELVLDRMRYMGLNTFSPTWSMAEHEVYEELWIKFERLITEMEEE